MLTDAQHLIDSVPDGVAAEALKASVVAAREARKTRRRLERDRQRLSAESRRPRHVFALVKREQKLSDGWLMTGESQFSGPAIEVILSNERGDVVTVRLTVDGRMVVRVHREGRIVNSIDYPPAAKSQ